LAAEKTVTRVICGFHPIEEALRKGTRTLGALYLAAGRGSSRAQRLAKLARSRGLKVKRVDTRTLDRMTAAGNHQGIAATVEVKSARDLTEYLGGIEGEQRALVAVLDGVQDPHNLGAVIRNCSLNGAGAVVLPRDRTTGITPTVEKVAAGALEYVEVVRVGNLAAALRKLKEERFWVHGADPGGDVDLQNADFRGRVAIVVGEEHRGLRRLTKEHCDSLVRIPSTGRVASYNMATASGLFLFSAFLQQRSAPPSRGPKDQKNC
jgi:23S rRNA (guanosine2251-2'-O)-methyltransferase